MSMMIDWHSHILPGIDDGSTCVEESLALLRAEADQGIRRVIATPHFYAHHSTPEVFLENRRLAEQRLREAAAEQTGLPEISLGAEVYYFQGMHHCDALRELTIGGSEYILIELPFGVWTDKIYRELTLIHKTQGLIPIIAHVDRYLSPLARRQIPERLAELPVLVQANGEFFLNRFTAGKALRMLRQGHIHLLGSDCHNTTARKPNLGAATVRIRRSLGDEALGWIRENEEAILSSFSPQP